MGKLLLASLPDEEQRSVLASMKLTKRGPNTITSKKALRAELDEAQQEGLAVNDEELAPGCWRSPLRCAMRRGTSSLP